MSDLDLGSWFMVAILVLDPGPELGSFIRSDSLHVREVDLGTLISEKSTCICFWNFQRSIAPKKITFQMSNSFFLGHANAIGVHDDHRAEHDWMNLLGPRWLIRNLMGPPHRRQESTKERSTKNLSSSAALSLIMKLTAMLRYACLRWREEKQWAMWSQWEECFAPPLSRLLSRARVL